MQKSGNFAEKGISLTEVKNLGCLRTHSQKKFAGFTKTLYLCIVNQRKTLSDKG